ncbi:MAG TPA: tRNA (adenosine(37)-N6)-threonylcarbamoyltransferase complex transferase subunit TsaD [Terriglobia bacterium]|nr:tRNA (adenosine(37)-N6)-threonylcarbamoyltransferase complex transferase subunit TsaD [Terriglobia bacterium]
MLVLGIESSCDETAAAIVADGRQILSSVVASQIPTHAKYGGVVPELASREHLRKIAPVVHEACQRARVEIRDVDGVAVTEGPGLVGSLLVGLVYGKALALALAKPLVGVNHLEGHIHAVLLENRMDRLSGRSVEQAQLPAVTLVVSGGHTSLFLVEEGRPPNNSHPFVFKYQRLGQTRDDAAGEAFDKVAKLLALGYPGGPVIDQLARSGDKEAVDFGRIKMKGNPLDFSFSGLKTAVLYQVRGTPLALEAEQRRAWRQTRENASADELRAHCSQATLDLIASFQNAVVRDLVERTLAAAEASQVDSVWFSGGVACNSLLRVRFAEASRSHGFRLLVPSPALCTDNAAMIAAAGHYKIKAGQLADGTLTAHASFLLGEKLEVRSQKSEEQGLGTRG